MNERLRIRLSPLALALLAGLGTARAADAPAAAEAAWDSFLEGRLEEASSSFRYLATLGVASPDPDVNLAILARDLGRHDDALTHWVKSSLEERAGGFVWNQRGWAYASLDRLPEARSSFLKAVDRSSTTAAQAEAQLGLGVVARLESQPRQALTYLRSASVASPFTMAAASYETAQAASSAGDKYGAIAYLRQCVSLDPLNLECLKELASLHARTGENRAAWYAYLRLLSLDPADAEAVRQVKKLREYISGDPEAALPMRRLANPLLGPDPAQGEEPASSSDPVRVALYSAPDGKPATATRLYFIANSDFRIVAASGDVVKDDGRGGRQWELAFRPENNLVELRDNARTIHYIAKQPFRIIPGGRQPSVLLKSARFTDPVGIDLGDRELRGLIEVIPTPYGFKLVNEVGLEPYLFGVVSAALPQNSPSEAYKAQAVVSRTRTLWSQSHRVENLERTDVCDGASGGVGSACQPYLGISAEMHDAAEGVRATAGVYLARGIGSSAGAGRTDFLAAGARAGAAALVLQHADCGGLSEDGRLTGPDTAHLVPVSDGERPLPLDRSPDRLESWTHEYPPGDRFCQASGLTLPVESRWLRIIPAAEIAARAERTRFIGTVRHLRALKRSASGRVRALEVVGSKGSLILEGEQAIASVLSPGSLRSTWFTVQPLMAGAKADRFLIWGAGTGHGMGMCRAGALGQASMGRKWQSILAHYFPSLQLVLPAAPRGAAPAEAAGQRKKPKNPRWKKK